MLASAKATFGADGNASVVLKPGKKVRKALGKRKRALAFTVTAQSRRPDRVVGRDAHPLMRRKEATMHRITILAAAAVTAFAVAAAPAAAHTEVKSTSPVEGHDAGTRIRTVTVTFTQAIRRGTMRVTGPGGAVVSSGSGGRDPRKISRLGRAEGLAQGRQLHARAGRSRPPTATAGAARSVQARKLMRAGCCAASPRWRRAAAAPAQAHVQVAPTEAAPGDPVLFQLLVPGERDAHTVEVALQVPRTCCRSRSRTGRLEAHGRAGATTAASRSSAGAASSPATASCASRSSPTTPEQEGEIVWKAIQTYDDGEEAAGSAPPDAENPAP